MHESMSFINCIIMFVFMSSVCWAQIDDNNRTSTLDRNDIDRVSTENTNNIVASTEAIMVPTQDLVCPENNTSIPLLTLPCERQADCKILGPGLLCCERKNILFKRCLRGVPAQKPEPAHAPWLGVIPRTCPAEPIVEFREIKTCTSDADCSPRICCPERGGGDNYCRTPVPQLQNFPTVRRMLEPFTSLISYLQCSTTPSLVLDLFPRTCTSMFDCFPNLCCQEQGRRVCRPPKQSVLSVLGGFTRRIFSSSSSLSSVSSVRQGAVNNGN